MQERGIADSAMFSGNQKWQQVNQVQIPVGFVTNTFGQGQSLLMLGMGSVVGSTELVTSLAEGQL